MFFLTNQMTIYVIYLTNGGNMADALENYEYEDEPLNITGKIPFKGCTYKDYLSWGEDVRCELIDGIPYMMAGVSLWHQDLLMAIFKQLYDFLEGKTCKVIIAPFDVRLFPEENKMDKTVVQPDIMVVCDPKKLEDGKACKGAPDFIIEILSPSAKGRDLIDKKELYEKAGVKEYWIIDTDKLYKNILTNGIFVEEIIKLECGDKINVDTLKDCVFTFPTIQK